MKFIIKEDQYKTLLRFGILLLFTVLLTIPVGLLYFFQGKFYTYQEPIEESDYGWNFNQRFVIYTLKGLSIKSFEFARASRTRANLEIFYKGTAQKVEVISENNSTHEKLLAVWGKNIGSLEVLSLLRYKDGNFSLIPIKGAYNSSYEVFDSLDVRLDNLDNDSDLEISENDVITYSNTGNSTLFINYFDYDPLNEHYVLVKRVTEPITDRQQASGILIKNAPQILWHGPRQSEGK